MKNKRTETEQNLQHLFNNLISQGEIAGAACSILHQGEVAASVSCGYADIAQKKPVENDTIFRLYSMSKPVASVGFMILLERGLIDIMTPLSEYLPEYKHMKVASPEGLVDANREILILDVLRMTSGIVYPDLASGDIAGQEMDLVEQKIRKGINSGIELSTREVCREIAKVPLAFQPGAAWRYGFNVDVMGGVIEVITGKTLGAFYRDEIFYPLDMTDTDFFVPKEKQDRLAILYQYDEELHGLTEDTNRHLGLTFGLTQPGFESGGAGLYSTLRDYSIFAAMLAGRGTYQNTQILSASGVAFFEKNQLEPQQFATFDWDQIVGHDYANFMRIYRDPKMIGCLGTVGEFGWDGWTGPYFTADIHNDLAIVMMLQRGGYCNVKLLRQLRNIAHSIL